MMITIPTGKMHAGTEIRSMKRSAMSRTDMEERPSKKTKGNELSIGDLAKELQTEIFARVAADSCADIANCKLSCKFFKELAEDQYVYRNASLDKIPLVLWTDTGNELEFLERCKQYMNPEITYRQAVVDFFNKRNLRSASELLQTAVNLGHEGAMYLTSIVLMLSGDKDSRKNGMKLLSSLERRKVRECRNRLQKYLNNIWVNIEKSVLPVCCTATEANHKKRVHWKEEEYGDTIQCEACLADFEIRCIFGDIE